MTYQTAQYQAYVTKLQQLKNIGWINNQLQLKKKPNFWSILEYGEQKGLQARSAHETRSSKMLRWLVDANENHGLGNIVAHKLITLIGGNSTFEPEKNKAIKATAEDMDIDVLYKDFSQNVCLAIEVKQFAKEGITSDDVSQLDKYKELVEERVIGENTAIQPYYIYLTPLKDKPSNNHWHAVSYEQLITIIDHVLANQLTASTIPYAADTKKLMTDFKEDLQRTVDYLQKDHTEIKELFSEQEKELTLALAEEIQHEAGTKHLAELDANHTDGDIYDLILLVKDYMKAQKQNHAPNDAVRILMRKIFNYLSATKQLPTDELLTHSANDRIAPIKPALIAQYNLAYDKVELTGGKGQGLYLHNVDGKKRIYLSGDAHGHFPNDSIQLLNEDKKISGKAQHVKNKQYLIKNEQIVENTIGTKEGATLAFDDMMEAHIMQAIKELNDAKGS